MPFRRITLTLLIGFFVAIGTITPAQAASTNWLDRSCTKRVTTACTVIPESVDSLVRDRSLTFRDGTGATITATTRARVWSIATAHSKPCPKRGYQTGCTLGNEPGIGRAIVLHDGMSIAVRLFR